jgi:hypothetical protein
MRKITKAVDLINGKIVLDGCMVTASGFIVDLMNPDPETILIDDIAHGLANNCRWNGHTQEFWSVAQHCCMMFDAAPKEERLTYLFHDVEEAYWGDIIKPLKNIIAEKCPEILAHMREMRKLIYTKFKIPYVYGDEGVKTLDFHCLLWEFEHIIKNNSATYWTPKRAKKEWLKRYYSYIADKKDFDFTPLKDERKK